MLRLLALGTLSFVGYKFFQSRSEGAARRNATTHGVDLAGGPLTTYAALQSDPDVPPAFDPYTGAAVPSSVIEP